MVFILLHCTCLYCVGQGLPSTSFSQRILELGLDSISCDYAKEDWNIYQEWEEDRWSLNIDNSQLIILNSQFSIHNSQFTILNSQLAIHN